jgi:hypothetical protein
LEELDFGFLFCRVAHFYGYDDERILGWTMRRFWMFHENVDRISAQQDMRRLTVAACAQSGEAATDYRRKLIVEVGDIAKMSARSKVAESAQRDEGGIDLLKGMAEQTIGSRV